MGAWLLALLGGDRRVRSRAGDTTIAAACRWWVLVVGVLAVAPASASAAGWAIQVTPNPDGAAGSELLGVSCMSATACTAVGRYTSSSSATGGTLAEHWNGTTWVIQPTPNPAGAAVSDLDSVSCTSPSACVALGSSDGSPLAESWNGSTWVIQPPPNPPAGSLGATLDGVSCASANDCIAVGYANFSGNEESLAEHWNGSTWEIQPTPSPNGATGSKLTGVSCRSASACTAVGYSYYVLKGVLNISRTLAERWDGTTWMIQPTPNPAARNTTLSAHVNQLNGVSCSRALLVSGCTAVGFYENNFGYPMTLAESWSGRRWSVQPTPNPPGIVLGGLRGVSCTFALIAPRCTAVGGAGGSAPFAERRQGLTWTLQSPLPDPAIASILWGVSCTSANACTAVGSYLGLTDNTAFTLAERYS